VHFFIGFSVPARDGKRNRFWYNKTTTPPQVTFGGWIVPGRVLVVQELSFFVKWEWSKASEVSGAPLEIWS